MWASSLADNAFRSVIFFVAEIMALAEVVVAVAVAAAAV
jgi:hypothetical protein